MTKKPKLKSEEKIERRLSIASSAFSIVATLATVGNQLLAKLNSACRLWVVIVILALFGTLSAFFSLWYSTRENTGYHRGRRLALILCMFFAFVSCAAVSIGELGPRIFRQSCQYDMNKGWGKWESGNSVLKPAPAGKAVVFSGNIDEQGAGYRIQSQNLGLEHKQRIIFQICGVSERDTFDHQKLFKLEINDRGQLTETADMVNSSDAMYVNAQNGECVFNIIKFPKITKLNLTFINCAIENLTIAMYIK